MYLSIKTLDAGEAAISYGGFINEIFRNDFKLKRIENPNGEIILQNTPCEDLIKQKTIINFFEKHLAEGPTNKTSILQLKTAFWMLVCWSNQHQTSLNQQRPAQTSMEFLLVCAGLYSRVM